MKKERFDKLSSVKCYHCGKPLKLNLINKGIAKMCFKCYMKFVRHNPKYMTPIEITAFYNPKNK